jgi:hypothetical protein
MYNDVPGVDANANCDMGSQTELRDSSAHRQCCAASVNGMFFACNRGAKQAHDAVPAGLVYKTVVLVNGIHQNLQHGAKEFERLLWIQLFD